MNNETKNFADSENSGTQGANSPVNNQEKRQNSLKRFNKKKRKKLIKAIIIAIIAIALIIFGIYKAGYLDKMLGKEDLSATTVTTYSLTEQTAYRTITKVLTSTGTLSPNDQYSVTALVSGEILSDHFNKGDTVIEDQLLFEIESDSLDSNVTRARNSLKNAQTSLDEAREKLEKLNVDTDYSGIIQEIDVEIGDEVNQGQVIAEIIDNTYMILEIPFLDDDASKMKVGDKAIVTFIESPEELQGVVDEIKAVTSVNEIGATTRNVKIAVKNPGGITLSTLGLASVNGAFSTSHGTFSYSDEGTVKAEISGKVTDIYYNEGSYITKGSILVKLQSTSLENQIESLEISVENAETSLEDALDAYDNYNITSPISGTVISKNYKQGDTITTGGGSSSQLAVIYDMSALKFTMSIDELDIDSLEEGQEVIVTSDSRQGYKYTGVITNVSIQGTTSSGTTVYPVEVTIENVEDESKRTVSQDGTINKVYKTGMTSTVKDYSLTETSTADGASVYTYGDVATIKKVDHTDGFTLYLNDRKLNKNTADSYILGTTIYTFSEDFSTVTIEEQNQKKMLRPGMNIDAEIIVEKRENVLAIPVSAVGRGNTVKVLKKTEESSESSEGTTENKDATNDKDKSEKAPEGFGGQRPEGYEGKAPEGFGGQRPEGSEGKTPEGFGGQSPEGFAPSSVPNFGNRANAYGTADVNAEYETVTVSIGISDEEYVEIVDGLEIGDVIIIDNARTSSGNQMMGMMGMGGGMGMGGMGARPTGGMGMGGMGARPSGGMGMGGMMR